MSDIAVSIKSNGSILRLNLPTRRPMRFHAIWLLENADHQCQPGQTGHLSAATQTWDNTLMNTAPTADLNARQSTLAALVGAP